ncbi:MAG: aminoglycoside phosphotransferase family protein [Candidatus Manganitrophaceae bacterium]|nr:MAG: aminoglycoside phosphotransferase family protein [Candidatus Manganitrophaceae bacterium]
MTPPQTPPLIDLPLAREICRRHRIGPPVWVSEPMKGMINQSYLFLLENGRQWVCRVNAHDRDLDKIGREAKSYRWLHQVAPDLPLALDYLPDCSKELLPFDYALIPFLKGRGVGEVIESLPIEKRNPLLEEIGRVLRRFHRIRIPFFGNRLDDPRIFPKEASWRDYLQERFDRALTRCEKDLGSPPTWKERLALRFTEGLQALPDTIEPVFLHGDFHYDNLLFVEGDSGALRISGVFDLEWAWWGDAAADLLHLEEAFFFYPQDRAPFLAGYGEAAWPTERLKVYRTLHSLQVLAVGYETTPEPDWSLIARHEERLRLLAEGKNPMEPF